MNAVAPETTSAPSQLAEFIVAEVHRQTSEDKLRAHVEKKIGEAIEGAVNDAFRSYGSVNKQIEEVVKKALDLNGHTLDVPAYGNMVMALLRAKMDETLSDLVNGKLGTELNEILSIAPKELKLRALVDAMVKDASEDMAERYGTSVTCIIEESDNVSGYHRIYLDESDDVKKYECEAQIAIDKEGRIYSLQIDRKDAKTTVVMGSMSDWKKSIFAAYCSGSKFIIDEFHPSTGIGDY